MAKGFRTGQGPQRTAHIDFAEGHALHGLEMEIGLRVPVGVILAADRDVLGVGIKAMAERVVAWNLEDDDGPVGISEEAFRKQFDIMEAAELVKAWIEAVTQPSDPLGEPSSGRASSANGSIPMASPSRSRSK